ncbi:MAG: hypothetical protein ACRDVD_05245 [Acidimicrobiia bacterium]
MRGDFHRVEFGASQPAHPSPSAPSQPPSDSVLVPLDQWNRLLGQLGNIHEAGQQLADARERMARAETENEFLKERIRDMRDRLGEKDDPPAQPPEVTPQPAAENAPRRRLRVELVVPRWATRLRRRD